MNVEKISALEQVKSMLSRAYNAADRQLRDPFGDKESVSSYLLTKIQIVTNEIDAFITEEENAFETYYSVEAEPVLDNLSGFPLDDSSAGSTERFVPGEGEQRARTAHDNHAVDNFPDVKHGLCFNPLINSCASEIASAFCDCWVEVKALKPSGRCSGIELPYGSNPDYTISIQPDGYTPNDIQLTLKSLGYTPNFKSIKEYSASAWVYFDVSYNGIAFELSSTVSEIDPPDIDRYSEPATDDELPF